MTDFRKLLRALTDAGVEFIIVGGVAAVAHGSSRLTQDIDVVYERSSENIARLAAALSGLNPYLRGAPKGLPFTFDEATISHGLRRAAGRPKDLEAIAELEALLEERGA